MNLILLAKNFINISLVLFLCSCGWILNDHRFDYLKEEQGESLKVPNNESVGSIVDFYPVPSDEGENIFSNSYDIPLPQQVFSSGSTNQIRMHKLGELRWLYIESLPSTVWPLMKDFFSLSDLGLFFEDPNTGVIQSEEIVVRSSSTRLEMKIEHGIRQASSEIFLSHLMKDQNNLWVKVPLADNIEEKFLRKALDFLSETPSTGGTSLVALNLNLGQKAVLKQSDDGTSFIEMDLEFPRAWAAVDRALKEALIVVQDLDREAGVFFVTFEKKEERGLVKRLFIKTQDREGSNFKVLIQKIGKNKCVVTVNGETGESEIYERDLLSEINQSLS